MKEFYIYKLDDNRQIEKKHSWYREKIVKCFANAKPFLFLNINKTLIILYRKKLTTFA
jgi:hypothetical protein